MSHQNLSVYYDGECPLCSRYVRHTRLKKTMEVSLLDLRNHPDKVSEFKALELDVDEGMIVVLDGIIYHGAEAMHVLTLLSTASGLVNRCSRLVFSHRLLARIFYPALVGGRNLLLRILGRKKINAE